MVKMIVEIYCAGLAMPVRIHMSSKRFREFKVALENWSQTNTHRGFLTFHEEGVEYFLRLDTVLSYTAQEDTGVPAG